MHPARTDRGVVKPTPPDLMEDAGTGLREDPEGFETETVPDDRPFLLRPRGRATAMVVVLGVPLLLAYLAAQTLPDSLWFREVGQADVFSRLVVAKVEFRLLVIVTVALFVAADRRRRRRPRCSVEAGNR